MAYSDRQIRRPLAGACTEPYPDAMTQWGIDTLFNPGKRHMDEEKRRLQSTREEIGDSSGGKRIDLESGKVRLTGQRSEADEPDEQAAEGQDAEGQDGTPDAESQDGEGQDGTPDAANQAAAEEPDDTPAARARRRRRAG